MSDNEKMHISEIDLKLKMLKTIELNMLKECIRICEKYHLRYFLLGGSALGSVRHAGFIPWDDDIDVGMPRYDYEKFLSVAQSELGSDLFLQTYKTDPAYPLNFAKIRNSKTTFVQSNVSHIDMNHGVYIDIFPLDGYPARSLLKRSIKIAFNIYVAAILRKSNVPSISSMTTIKSTISKFLVIILSTVFSLNNLRRLLDNLIRRYDYEKCDVVINWHGAWGLKEAVPKDFFEAGRRVKFEGITVIIPINYDGYLKSLYGDYMTPPPIEKRISHHFANVIDLENSYTKHIRGQQ